jgi:hypothetical protein
LSSTVAPLATGDSSSSPPYILRSYSQASLFLHSPLCVFRQPRRITLQGHKLEQKQQKNL